MTYGKVHERSLDTVSSALDLFAAPETKTSVLEGSFVEIGPLRDPSGSQIDFTHETSGFNYLDTSNTRLHVQAEANGANLSNNIDDFKVVPVTNFLHTLFSIVQISYGNHDIYYEANYPFAAYIENLLGHGEACKKSILGSELWIEGSVGVVDTDQAVDGKLDVVKKVKSSSDTNVCCICWTTIRKAKCHHKSTTT